MNYNQSISVNTRIVNQSINDLTNVELAFSGSDGFTNISDAVQEINSIASGETIEIENAFEVSFKQNTENLFQSQISSLLTSDELDKQTIDILNVNSPEMNLNTPMIMDNGNGALDPGETTNIIIPVSNLGLGISDVDVELISLYEEITINTPVKISYGDFQQNATEVGSFNISIHEDISLGNLYPFKLRFYNQEELLFDEIDFNIMVGKTNVLILDLDLQKRSGPKLRKTLNYKNISYEYQQISQLKFSLNNRKLLYEVNCISY